MDFQVARVRINHRDNYRIGRILRLILERIVDRYLSIRQRDQEDIHGRYQIRTYDHQPHLNGPIRRPYLQIFGITYVKKFSS